MRESEPKPIQLESIMPKDAFLLEQPMDTRTVILQAEEKSRKPLKLTTYERIAEQMSHSRPSEQTVFDKQSRESMLEVYRRIKDHAHSGIVNSDNMQATIEDKIKGGSAIKFVTYWGGSDKDTLSQEDTRWWERIQYKVNDVAAVYNAGVELHVIFADHHVKTNGFTKNQTGALLEETKSYWTGIGSMIATTKDDYQTSGTAISIQTHSLDALRNRIGVLDVDQEIIDNLFDKYKNGLVTNAANRAKKAQTEPVDEVAKGYIKMRYEEKGIMSEEFGDAILIVPGVATGVNDIILADGMSAVVLGGKAPWFVKE